MSAARPAGSALAGQDTRFMRHSQQFLDHRMADLLKTAEKNKRRLTLDEFQKKNKLALDELFGGGADESETARYRKELDKQREQQLARGRNHSDLKQKLAQESQNSEHKRQQSKNKSTGKAQQELKANAAERPKRHKHSPARSASPVHTHKRQRTGTDVEREPTTKQKTKGKAKKGASKPKSKVNNTEPKTSKGEQKTVTAAADEEADDSFRLSNWHERTAEAGAAESGESSDDEKTSDSVRPSWTEGWNLIEKSALADDRDQELISSGWGSKALLARSQRALLRQMRSRQGEESARAQAQALLQPMPSDTRAASLAQILTQKGHVVSITPHAPVSAVPFSAPLLQLSSPVLTPMTNSLTVAPSLGPAAPSGTAAALSNGVQHVPPVHAGMELQIAHAKVTAIARALQQQSIATAQAAHGSSTELNGKKRGRPKWDQQHRDS